MSGGALIGVPETGCAMAKDLFGDEIDSEKRKKTRPKTPQQTWPASVYEAIYWAYPRHVGKAYAIKAIERALRHIAQREGIDDPAAWLVARVEEFATSPAGQKGDLTPHPATWFNGGRYDDDTKEWFRDGTKSAGRLSAPCGKYDRFGK